MKHSILCLALATLSLSTFAATPKRLTITELTNLLTSLKQAKKSDDQVAAQLSAVELSEELTSAAMHSLGSLIPGPLSTEQIYVLEARSSTLPAPAADLPVTPAPDPAAQQALLAKAQDYVAKTYAQLPPFTASRMTARFQDGTQTIQSFTGAKVKSVNDQDPIFDDASVIVHLKNTHTDSVRISHGLTQSTVKEKTAWGSNGFVTSTLPPMPLSQLLQEITAGGAPTWLRWELIQGKPAAVFSFSVDKKSSHYALNYCCFPETSNIGNSLYGANARPLGGGNLSTVSNWKNFTTKSGYHGELFLDPATGVVLRTIVQADFKPSDFVHSEQIRVDYTAVPIAGQPLTVPIRTFTLSEIVPNADSFAAKYAVRHDLVTEDFKDFATAK